MSAPEDVYAGAPTDWGRWGPDDQIGRVNLLDDAAVLAAARCIRTGRRFSLALPVGHPDGDPVFPGRQPGRLEMVSDHGTYRDGASEPLPGGACFADDVLTIPCHGTTHLDALGHPWLDGRLWNGVPASSTTGGLEHAGVGAIASVGGVVARAVLADVARSRGVQHLSMGEEVTVEDVRTALERQGTALGRADVLIVRTGILTTFYQDPAAFAATFDEPGLTASSALIELVDDHDLVGLGTDTLSNELAVHPSLGAGFPLHVLLQRNLGVTFHEGLWLEDWAAHCAATSRWDAFYVAAPLRLLRASGSPVNPIVIT